MHTEEMAKQRERERDRQTDIQTDRDRQGREKKEWKKEKTNKREGRERLRERRSEVRIRERERGRVPALTMKRGESGSLNEPYRLAWSQSNFWHRSPRHNRPSGKARQASTAWPASLRSVNLSISSSVASFFIGGKYHLYQQVVLGREGERER